jgi:fibro-slime domain-containing protein
MTLPTTIRDFVNPAVTGYAAHPDFEGVVGGLQTGAVQNTLGLDGKPVWATEKSGFTTEANFDQWYRDVAGINVSTAYDLVLTETAPGSGVYNFESSSFFPIDGQLLGNQDRPHNYHFTLELHSLFTYQAGQTFSFTGDDDLWLFINEQLVVDLGGVHSAVTGSVDLDTLGLVEGQDYGFDLFFAERHTTESNFKMTTAGLVLRPPSPVPDAGGSLLLAGLGCGLLLLFRHWFQSRVPVLAANR